MIIEGLCTTTNPDGTINIAPMGPVVNRELTSFLFRPYQTSTTFANLKSTRCGVFHVTDDVEMIAQAALRELHPLPELFPATEIAGQVIAGTCRWYEFEVTSIDDSRERTEIQTRIVHEGKVRDFWGWNRAKHAVLEAAILCTRLHLLPRDEVDRQIQHLSVIIEKTAGDQEQAAFEYLRDRIRAHPP